MTTRKQRLPREFWTDINLDNKKTYCFWYAGAQMKKCVAASIDEARSFIDRATERNVAAFATAYVEAEAQNQVFACSYKGVLCKYDAVDAIRMEIGRANRLLIQYPVKKAQWESESRQIEQWSKKEYGLKYASAEYRISWYNTSKHIFEEEVFARYQDADARFGEKKIEDQPVRLVECEIGTHKIHEVKAACQHWHIGMGKYLEQAANKTLPLGEIPYIFSNHYMSSDLKIDGKYGYLDFYVGREQYSIQIGRGMSGVNIDIAHALRLETLYYVIIDNNPVLSPWISRIR